MNATTGRILATVRIFLALLVGSIAGFWGLVILFSDFAPHWSYATWALYVLGGHLLAGILIGMLLPSRWWLSIGAAWGSILIGVMGLVAVLRPASAGTAPAASFLGGLAFPTLTLLGIPAVVAFGGYAASRAVARWRRRSTSIRGIERASTARH
ncbi:MAG: hypothetical protein M3068_12400 [Gemmatimonadota bacterium]|nr:hypothetical protein [Gemmatimonadota bacterium]